MKKLDFEKLAQKIKAIQDRKFLQTVHVAITFLYVNNKKKVNEVMELISSTLSDIDIDNESKASIIKELTEELNERLDLVKNFDVLDGIADFRGLELI